MRSPTQLMQAEASRLMASVPQEVGTRLAALLQSDP